MLAFVFMLSAVVIAILNLNRVAGLGWKSLPALLIIFGAVMMIRARKAERK